MDISQSQLAQAVQEGILSREQAERLALFVDGLPSSTAKFDFTHLLYYFGGLVAIGAMTLFMTLGWESFGGWGIVTLCAVYATAGIMLANRLAKKGLPVVAGISATFVVCLTPLATFALQHALGAWPSDDNYRDYHRYVQWHWLYMELATLAVGAALARSYRYPLANARCSHAVVLIDGSRRYADRRLSRVRITCIGFYVYGLTHFRPSILGRYSCSSFTRLCVLVVPIWHNFFLVWSFYAAL
jgi:hypothetical protein